MPSIRDGTTPRTAARSGRSGGERDRANWARAGSSSDPRRASLSSCSGSSEDTATPSSSANDNTTIAPTAECEALYGPEPWLILFQETPTVACVSVAEHQDVQVWNKGYDETIVEWIDGRRVLPSDSSFATGRIGDVLDPGAHEFRGSPYRLPTIQVVAADESAAASQPTAVVETGMALGEARTCIRPRPRRRPGPDAGSSVLARCRARGPLLAAVHRPRPTD